MQLIQLIYLTLCVLLLLRIPYFFMGFLDALRNAQSLEVCPFPISLHVANFQQHSYEKFRSFDVSHRVEAKKWPHLLELRN